MSPVTAPASADRSPELATQDVDLGFGHAQRHERPPPPALSGLVGSLYGYRYEFDRPIRHRTMPGATVPLIVTFGADNLVCDPHDDSATSVSSFVAGMHDRHGFVEAPEFHGMQANLTPLGAHQLLGPAFAEARATVVELETVLPGVGNLLVERLATASDWPTRIDTFETFLAQRMHDGPQPHPEVVAAWHLLEHSGGRRAISSVADRVGWSRRHLTTRFGQAFGLSPKRMARLLRFDRAVALLRRSGGPELGRIAVDAGYYDQAHFANEVRTFCGLTPTDLLALRDPVDANFLSPRNGPMS